jgi:hypothetical protein
MRTEPVARPGRVAALAWTLALSLAMALLAGCGPGTGGTGVPPTGTGTGSSSASADTPAATTPSTGASTAPPAFTAPSSPPLVEGTIDSLDAQTLTVNGLPLPRAQTRVLQADGSALPDTALHPGLRLRVWQDGAGYLALVLG